MDTPHRSRFTTRAPSITHMACQNLETIRLVSYNEISKLPPPIEELCYHIDKHVSE